MFERALTDLHVILNELGLNYAIGGSVASTAWGEPRQTNDIDILLELPQHSSEAFRALVSTKFLLGEAEFAEALSSKDEYRPFQLLHQEDHVKIDVFLSGTPLSASELQRATPLAITGSVSFPVLTPENIILRKLLWYRMGNRISDRQWNDVVKVIEVQGDALDLEYLNEWAQRLQLTSMLEEAFADASAGD